jgi:hypothetical protein
MKGALLEKQHVMIDTARGSLVHLGTLPRTLVYGKGIALFIPLTIARWGYKDIDG